MISLVLGILNALAANSPLAAHAAAPPPAVDTSGVLDLEQSPEERMVSEGLPPTPESGSENPEDLLKSAPVIQQEIGGGRCQITLGSSQNYNDSLNEAKDLVVVLRAGALPAPIRPSNEQLIGPSLGQDAIQKGGMGALIGIALVIFFMLIYYEVGGIIADVAVLLNLLFLFALMAMFEATLTLPGVAGIALTVGMAVDANVLINERIREELRAGKSARAAVDQGFDRAFWSIFDGQITTLIAGIVLFQYGTGPIKGFAVTLMIGIVTSLFTGVFCSRLLFDLVVRGMRVKTLKVG